MHRDCSLAQKRLTFINEIANRCTIFLSRGGEITERTCWSCDWRSWSDGTCSARWRSSREAASGRTGEPAAGDLWPLGARRRLDLSSAPPARARPEERRCRLDRRWPAASRRPSPTPPASHRKSGCAETLALSRLRTTDHTDVTWPYSHDTWPHDTWPYRRHMTTRHMTTLTQSREI